MTIGELLWDVNYDKKGVLKKLICYYCELSKEQMWIEIDRNIDDVLPKIKESYNKYVDEKMPLEYIFGKVTFCDYDFIVDRNTLIPRPETEYMIEAVNEKIAELIKWKNAEEKIYLDTRDSRLCGNDKVKNENDKIELYNKDLKNILRDVGTGCGVLGLSALIHNPWFFHEAILCDYSQEALEVARENYRKLAYGLQLIADSEGEVLFMKSDLLEGVLKRYDCWEDDLLNLKDLTDEWDCRGRFTPSQWQSGIGNMILVANLPYIPDNTFDTEVEENVKNWEPRIAFVGWNDGLDLYRRMFDQLLKSLKVKELKSKSWLIMFLEMMTWQVEILRKEYEKYFVFDEIKTFHFNIRIVEVRVRD